LSFLFRPFATTYIRYKLMNFIKPRTVDHSENVLTPQTKTQHRNEYLAHHH
jgi:hypothetical protein